MENTSCVFAFLWFFFFTFRILQVINILFLFQVVVVDPEGGDSAHLNDAKLDDNYGVYLGPCPDIGPDVTGDGGGDDSRDVVNDVVYPAEESGGDSYSSYNSLSINSRGGSNDIQLHHRDGTDEMSVAIDLAKLSQGHFSHNDFKNSG